jgi:hypothetical protein
MQFVLRKEHEKRAATAAAKGVNGADAAKPASRAEAAFSKMVRIISRSCSAYMHAG